MIIPRIHRHTLHRLTRLHRARYLPFRVHTPDSSPHTVRFSSDSAQQQQQHQQEQQDKNDNTTKSPSVQWNSDFIKLLLRLWGQHLVRYTVIVAAVLLFAAAIYSVSNWFSSINFKNVAVWSFYTGALTGVCATVFVMALYGWFSIHPNTVYRAALKRVSENVHVVQKLERPLTPGKFRCYAVEYPDYGGNAHTAPLSRRMQFWKPSRLQLVRSQCDVM